MRTSDFPLLTVKETPADAEIISHQLMLRAGLIRKLSAGLYSWLPLGLRVLRQVERIVREEMDRAGALELLMPAVQPAELWQESGRWNAFGPELLRLQDRHKRDFCLGPTHEEIITDIVRQEIRSYRQLPVTFYQIQTKFRDEIRPRFGVLRAREFLMKDAYSFHLDQDSLYATYQAMHRAYVRIFERLGLRFRVVEAATGAIGGSRSQEFHVLADSGEDAIAFSDNDAYAANIEMAEAVAPREPRPEPSEPLRKIATPGQCTIEAVAAFLGIAATRCVKTLIVRGRNTDFVALVLRGDHQLNPLKAERLAEVFAPLTFAEEKAILTAIGCPVGSLGPLNLPCPVIADHSAAHLADFVCGANEEGQHLAGVNWGRDLDEPVRADLRNVVAGDASPSGRGRLQIARGIEVGHIFQLGKKYSEAMRAEVLDEQGKSQALWMGCYGIGVSRIVGAAIEQNHDERGIIWPPAMAPFVVALLPMNMHKSERLRAAAEALYEELCANGFSVLFDDRKVRPGFMFSDMELIGIPHRLVVSEKGLDAGTLEYRGRTDPDNRHIARDAIVGFLRDACR